MESASGLGAAGGWGEQNDKSTWGKMPQRTHVAAGARAWAFLCGWEEGVVVVGDSKITWTGNSMGACVRIFFAGVLCSFRLSTLKCGGLPWFLWASNVVMMMNVQSVVRIDIH